jgi:hypothetical protein
MFYEKNEEVYIKSNALKIKSLFNRRYIQIIDVSVSCLENILLFFILIQFIFNKLLKVLKRNWKNYLNLFYECE